MKSIAKLRSVVLNGLAAIALLLLQVKTYAQDKGLDVDIDINKKDEWYKQPWVWVVGAAVFILILVAILRGGKKS